MDYIEKLQSIAQNNGGIIETKTAVEHGISRATLSRLCKENRIIRIVKGQYIMPDDMQDELLSISKRSDSMKLPFFCMAYPTVHHLSTRLPSPPGKCPLCCLKRSAGFTI